MNAPVNKTPETASFLHLPVVSNWHGLDADVVIFGAPFGKPVLLALLDLAYCVAGRSVTVEVAGNSFDGSVKIGAVFDDTKRRLRPQKA